MPTGGQVPPSGCGTAAQSPPAQTFSKPSTRRQASVRTRPRSSRGISIVSKSGGAFVPTALTIVRVGTCSPFER